MTFLFVTWAGGGNSTPVMGLATRLMARGHRVKVASPDDMTDRFVSSGIDYEVLGRDPHDVLDLIERDAPALVIVDFMMPAWMNQAEASGRPWVAMVHTLYDRVEVGILTAFTTLDAINAERRELGLDDLGDAPDLLARAASVVVTAPRELDGVAGAPESVHWVGGILEEVGSDVGWQPPDAGRPLVCV